MEGYNEGRRRSSIQVIRDVLRRSSLASVKSFILGRRASTVSRTEPLTGTFLEQVRTVLTELIKENEADVHPADVKLVAENDHLIKFFIMDFAPNKERWDEEDIDEKSVNKVAKEGLSTLKFRKKSQIHDFTYKDFPKEFSEFECAHMTERPYPMTMLSFFCFRRATLPSEWKSAGVLYTICLTQLNFPNYEQTGLTMIVDCKGMSMSQLDIMGKTLYTAVYCFPGTVIESYVVDLPFMLKAGFYVASKAFPAHVVERLHFVNRAQLAEKFGKENLPTYLDGKPGPHVKTSGEIFNPDDCEAISAEDYANKWGLGNGAAKSLREAVVKIQKTF